MNLFSKIFSLSVVAVASLALPACSDADNSIGGKKNDPVTGAECTPGEMPKKAADGCNTCTCQSNGFWACTEIGCGTPPVCKAGDTKKADDGCNTCGCSDGQWACTVMACGQSCKTDGECGGLTIAICNTCSDGSEVCLQNVCNAGLCGSQMPPCPTPTACKPGDTKKEDCNTCGCMPDGQWACTAMACGGGCTPGEQQKAPDGCNACTCQADGTWACTEKACPPCQTDSDCASDGTCTKCADGSVVCEKVSCQVGQCVSTGATCPAPTACQPGDKMPAPDGCNTCICTPEGYWACTEIGCAETCKTDADCTQFDNCTNSVCQNSICIQIPIPGCGGNCKSDSDCGAPPPCELCPDGSMACATVACVQGQCQGSSSSCGGTGNQCKTKADCPQPGAPCEVCPDGSTVCPSVDCVNGVCAGSFPGCSGGGCSPQDAHGVGFCDAFFGFAWDGQQCVGLGGCSCQGTDCNQTYKSAEECKLAHQSCSGGGGGPSCKADSECPVQDLPCLKCVGLNYCGHAYCDNGACGYTPPSCGDSCAPQQAQGVGDCAAFFGYAWDGKSCHGLGGCDCQGSDCGSLYKSQAECQAIHGGCN